jgi:hypothetical protein
VGAAFLLRALATGLRAACRGGGLDGHQWRSFSSALVAATLLAPTLIADATFFDRYLLMLFPFVLGAMPPSEPAAPLDSRAAAAVIGTAFMLFSVAGTHDYLAWQRTRWAAVREIETVDRVAPAEIEAGFEIDNLPAEGPGTVPDLADRRGAPLVVAVSPLAGHTVLRRVEVPAWLVAAVDTVYVLVRPADGRLPR